jgi:hypothetical protein
MGRSVGGRTAQVKPADAAYVLILARFCGNSGGGAVGRAGVAAGHCRRVAVREARIGAGGSTSIGPMGTAMRLLVCACVLVVAVASAGAPPKQHSVEKVAQIDGDFEQTWAAVIEVLARHNWLIQNLEKGSGLIATDWTGIPLESPFVDCGVPGMVNVTGRSMRFNVLLRANGPRTSMTVNVAAVEVQSNDSGVYRVDCTSTGRLERRLHEEVAHAVAGGARSREVAPPAPAAGTVRGPCYGNQTCNAGLACSPQNVCIRVDPPAAPAAGP